MCPFRLCNFCNQSSCYCCCSHKGKRTWKQSCDTSREGRAGRTGVKHGSKPGDSCQMKPGHGSPMACKPQGSVGSTACSRCYPVDSMAVCLLASAALLVLLCLPGCRTSRRWRSQTRRLDRRSLSGGTRRGSSAPRSSCSAPWCEAAACRLAPSRPCRSRCRRHRSTAPAAAASAAGLLVLPRALACSLVLQSLQEIRCVAAALARPSRWARRPCRGLSALARLRCWESHNARACCQTWSHGEAAALSTVQSVWAFKRGP